MRVGSTLWWCDEPKRVCTGPDSAERTTAHDLHVPCTVDGSAEETSSLSCTRSAANEVPCSVSSRTISSFSSSDGDEDRSDCVSSNASGPSECESESECEEDEPEDGSESHELHFRRRHRLADSVDTAEEIDTAEQIVTTCLNDMYAARKEIARARYSGR